MTVTSHSHNAVQPSGGGIVHDDCAADAEIEKRIRALAATDAEVLWNAQREVSRAIAEAGMHFEGRAYPVCLRPLAITKNQLNEIARTAEAIVQVLDCAAEVYCRDSGMQQLFPAYGHLTKWTTRLPNFRPIVRICRLDGLIDSDGVYKIIETNTEGPGGVIQNGLAAKVWSEVKNPLTTGIALGVDLQPFAKDQKCFARELVATHLAATGQELKSAAVVSFRGRFTHEVDWLVATLQQLGVEAASLDAASIKRTPKGVVGPDGKRIELVYNKLDVRDMVHAPEVVDYLTACAEGEVTSVNPWISQWVLSDKAILAMLGDERFAENLTATQREVVRRHVPWTRYVSEGTTTDPEGRRVDLLAYVKSNRANLVLKPSNATRGERVLVGPFTSAELWDEHLKHTTSSPYVVQEYVKPKEVTTLHPQSMSIESMVNGIDTYVFGGRFAGFMSRASFDPVMNVGKSGIILPVAIA